MSFKSQISFLILLSGLISGCASTFDNLASSATTATKLDDALDIDYVESVPYASAIITINDGIPVFLVLSNAEFLKDKGIYRLTWLTQDSESIVTEDGRIVHTVGFVNDNLEGLSFIENDLSANTNSSEHSSSPLLRYDWSPGYRYNFTAQIETRFLGMETLTTKLWTQDTEKIAETVTFDSLKAQFVNTYWRAPATDVAESFVLKSVQYLGPNMDKVNMSVVRPFVPYRSADKAAQGGQS